MVKSRVKLSGFDEALQEPVEALVRALRRLDPDQGQVARRGARGAVRDAIRRLERKVDGAFPTERRKPKRRRKPNPAKRVRELEAADWAQIAGLDRRELLERLAEAGIRVKRLRLPTRGSHGSGHVEQVWAPGWAIDVARSRPSQLAACRRKLNLRRAVLAEIALMEHGGAP